MKDFLKVFSLFIYAMATIATCSAVWNVCASPFLFVCAGLVFAGNAYAIYRIAKSLDLTGKNKKEGSDEG